ncbi:hypothetical protein SAMN06297144_1661 [Sphingomonas guangdongensis]|uniref:Phosphoglycolate phosphatase n=1 Tax=Sphingomonas guangdongensis TaxID=1141890 RepID=A0A285QX50_9SPHN|nr:hypothetical protein SAMN06297144_1661 [Sphingomonas guangdongensis]
MTRLALFDYDGTLAKSAANICRAVEIALSGPTAAFSGS